jgi:hypothetical protein
MTNVVASQRFSQSGYTSRVSRSRAIVWMPETSPLVVIEGGRLAGRVPRGGGGNQES